MLFGDKTEIRRAVRRRIAELTAEQRTAKSASIEKMLSDCDAIRGAPVVALYASLADEPQTRGLIESLSRTHTVVLPRVAGDDMDFYEYSPERMAVGAFGIEEPSGDTALSPEEIDVIIIPATAYTVGGTRLGRGRGYYDRYMSRRGFRATKIGVCFAEQIVEHIPAEPHDIAVDTVVSA
mgnify:FL=1